VGVILSKRSLGGNFLIFLGVVASLAESSSEELTGLPLRFLLRLDGLIDGLLVSLVAPMLTDPNLLTTAFNWSFSPDSAPGAGTAPLVSPVGEEFGLLPGGTPKGEGLLGMFIKNSIK